MTEVCGRGALLLALLLVGCGAEGEVIHLARSGCEACHRPVRPDGVPHGIERAHPPIEGRALSCTDCHGGDPVARRQSEAHVAPGLMDGQAMRGSSTAELDEIEPDYLRFINPGDLRVAPRSCGAGADEAAGGGCHQDVIDRVIHSPMATAAGEIDVTRYRAGMQPDEAGRFGIYDAFDDRFAASGAIPGATVESLRAFEQPPVAAGEQAVGPYQDLLLGKQCLRCHLWSFGQNRFDGGYRSGGCSACHMLYAEDGLSLSDDPTVDRGQTPHPVRHELTTAIPTRQCTTCHNGPTQLGTAFQGWRLLGAPETETGRGVPLGRALWGHDSDAFLVDEDGDDHDETPADLHFSAGMHCVDCHAGADVHGDGRLWTEGASAVRVRCEHCHGTVTERALADGHGPSAGLALRREGEGGVSLDGRVDRRSWAVPQLVDGLAGAAPGSALAKSHGPWEGGAGHTATVRCDACHSGWQSSCYGCHLTFDLRKLEGSVLTGQISPGGIAGGPGQIALDSLVLMLDPQGRIAPSVPAGRTQVTAIDGDGQSVFTDRIRAGPGGILGVGQRTFAPHTTQRSGPFSACDRCHPGQDDAKARQAAGFGSAQWTVTDDAGGIRVLDRVIAPDTFEPTVVVGHSGPERSRPLPRAVVERMLDVRVP